MPTTSPLAGTNLAVLVGTLSREPELRSLPSGSTLLALELTVRAPGTAAESVPVSWPEPPATATRWAPGDELLVIGRTRRRFFRAGGATQSRTEVVAARIVPTRRRAAADRALQSALAAISASL